MDHRAELVDVIRRVRNRWRLRLAVRGAVIVLAGTVLALLAVGVEPRDDSGSAPPPSSRSASSRSSCSRRSLLVALVWPLRRQVTDAQVALYLEERDPTLEAAILSAVEAAAIGDIRPRTRRAWSNSSSSRRSSSAAPSSTARVDRARDGAPPRRHARRALRSPRALLVALGPAYLRHGLSALLVISRSAEAASPYQIEVQPGNAKVPRGADQTGPREAGRLHVEGRRR